MLMHVHLSSASWRLPVVMVSGVIKPCHQASCQLTYWRDNHGTLLWNNGMDCVWKTLSSHQNCLMQPPMCSLHVTHCVSSHHFPVHRIDGWILAGHCAFWPHLIAPPHQLHVPFETSPFLTASALPPPFTLPPNPPLYPLPSLSPWPASGCNFPAASWCP